MPYRIFNSLEKHGNGEKYRTGGLPFVLLFFDLEIKGV